MSIFGDAMHNVFGSPAGGTLMNLLGNAQSQQAWQDWYDQEQAGYRNFSSHIGRMDRNEGILSGNVGRRLVGMTDSAFSPGATAVRFGSAFNGLRGQFAAVPGQLSRDNASALGTYGGTTQGILGDVSRLGSTLTSGYEANADRARGIVRSISDQEKIDANRRYNETGGAITANLVGRGLSGSGAVGSSLTHRNELERSGEVRRISDQTAREQLAVESEFGQEGLRAQERTGTLAANLGGEFAGTALSGSLTAAGNLATTQLGSIEGQRAIAQGQFDAETNAAIQRINAQRDAGTITVDAARIAIEHQLALWEGRIVAPPSGFTPGQILR